MCQFAAHDVSFRPTNLGASKIGSPWLDVHGMKCLISVFNVKADGTIQAQRAGIKHIVHVSGIGSDPRSPSLYIRKRGEGELSVLGAFANAIIIRPAVMFGPDDAFLTTILNLLKRLPIYPMFGRGRQTSSRNEGMSELDLNRTRVS